MIKFLLPYNGSILFLGAWMNDFVSPGVNASPQKRARQQPGRESEWRSYLESAARGDARALGKLYDESSGIVHAIANRVLRNAADAEEVTVDVYTQVGRTASLFDLSRGSVSSWLMMLARSRAIDKLRSRSKDARNDPLEAAGKNVEAPGIDPECVSWHVQRRERVQAALQSLSPEQRTAIELAFYSGFSQSELAAKLNQPLGTVKTRIRLGMSKLKEQLKPYMDWESR